MADNNTVPMFAPDGTSGDVPVAQAPQALSKQFTYAIPAKAPDGSTGYIPHTKIADAIAGGFIPQPIAPTNTSVVKPVTTPSSVNQSVKSGVDKFMGSSQTQAVLGYGLPVAAGAAVVGGGAKIASGMIKARRLETAAEQIGKLASTSEVGDAAQAVKDAAPKDLSTKGIRNALQMYRTSIGGQLGPILDGAKNRVADVSGIFNSLNQKARTASTEVLNEWHDLASAAHNATGGATGPLTPQQIQTAKQVFQKAVYSRETNPFVQQLAREAQQHLNGVLGQQVPEALEVLKRQSDIHAAMSAMKFYMPAAESALSKGLKVGAKYAAGGLGLGAAEEIGRRMFTK